MAVDVPTLCEPICLRSTHPAYSSFASSTNSVAAPEKKRIAVRAVAPSALLLRHLHKLTGYQEPAESELTAIDSASTVKVLGWRVVDKDQRNPHLVYTILAASEISDDGGSVSEARLVQRRYRHFEKLAAALVPYARAAGVSLPSLPTRFTIGQSIATIGATRKLFLHQWLRAVVAQPALMCDELRKFLGLAPQRLSVCHLTFDDGMDIDEPLTSGVPRTRSTDEEIGSKPASPAHHGFAVDLSELEQTAVHTLLDDDLWGRRQA